MCEDSGLRIEELRVDGGATHDKFLMQCQSDFARLIVCVPDIKEFSAIGAAYLAGISAGLYNENILQKITYTTITPILSEENYQNKKDSWDYYISMVISKKMKARQC